MFERPEIPMDKWSRRNNMICWFRGCHDARGFRQWQEVNRCVKKGEHAGAYIWAPKMKLYKAGTVCKKQTLTEDEHHLTGFTAIPMFGYAQTDGEPIEWKDEIAKKDPHVLPLIELAESLDVKVIFDFTSHGEHGSYSLGTGNIRLCTPEEQTFYHELAHKLDDHLGNLSNNCALNEVVAEMSALYMAATWGTRTNLQKTREYITGWSGSHPMKAIEQALDRVLQVIGYVHTWKATEVAA